MQRLKRQGNNWERKRCMWKHNNVVLWIIGIAENEKERKKSATNLPSSPCITSVDEFLHLSIYKDISFSFGTIAGVWTAFLLKWNFPQLKGINGDATNIQSLSQKAKRTYTPLQKHRIARHRDTPPLPLPQQQKLYKTNQEILFNLE